MDDITRLKKYDKAVPRYTSYPTAPQFNNKIVEKTYVNWLSKLNTDESISLYFHIPFCQKLCWYCGCNTRITSKYNSLSRYVNFLKKEIQLVANAMGIKHKVSHIHWGGGTPTYLTSAHMEELFKEINTHFNILPDAEIAVEIDPRTLTEEMALTLGRVGVNRASFGVQDFDKNVQEAINRIQPFEQVKQAMDWLKAAKIDKINFDLIYGLPLQNEKSIKRNIELAVKLNPYRVALFGYAHVPWMMPHQKLLEKHSIAGIVERYKLFCAGSKALKAAGYKMIGLDHFALPSDPMVKALKNKTLKRNFQGYTTDKATTLIGLGASSIGSLPQGYVQNSASTKEYEETISNGELPIVKGVKLTADDRLRREIINNLMCFNEVDVEKICNKYGLKVDSLSHSIEQVSLLQGDGLVEINGYRITVPSTGKPFVRIVAACFDGYLGSTDGRHAKAV